MLSGLCPGHLLLSWQLVALLVAYSKEWSLITAGGKINVKISYDDTWNTIKF